MQADPTVGVSLEVVWKWCGVEVIIFKLICGGCMVQDKFDNIYVFILFSNHHLCFIFEMFRYLSTNMFWGIALCLNDLKPTTLCWWVFIKSVHG